MDISGTLTNGVGLPSGGWWGIFPPPPPDTTTWTTPTWTIAWPACWGETHVFTCAHALACQCGLATRQPTTCGACGR